ncbi:hypothetical protein G9A89_013886 [Geosiphon pyriformis]|nr:hypothetical protein G9A89_013886 [Geosiphon pyriformis]
MSNSVNMKKKCLVKEISFDYGDGRAFTGKNLEQMLKSSKILIKKVLKKPLGKINFLNDNNDNILLDKFVVLSPLLKNLVNVFVKKSYALNINLNNVVGKSTQEKLVIIRKLFSKINGFGGASTPSKFAGIIRATFTSKSSLVQASKKTEKMKILVNTDLKKSSEHSDWAVILKKIPVGTSTEAVHAALSEFGVMVSIKIQLVGLWQKAVSILIGKDTMCVVRADQDKKSWGMRDQHRTLLYTLPIEITAHNIWNYIGFVSEKTCAINCYPVIYARARCAVVCFESANFLNAVIRTTPVLRDVNLRWSHLGFSKCVKYGKIEHTSLGCAIGENLSFGKPFHKSLSDMDKSRLAIIYVKYSALIACSVAFGGVFWTKIAVNSGFSLEIKPTLPDMSDIEKRFAVLESSLTSLVGQIGELAKRLDLFMLAVSQSSPGCQLLVTPPLQDQVGNIVMGKGLGKATSGKTAVILDFSAFPKVKKLENILVWKIAMCNIRDMNNPTKQDDIIYWHKEMNNLISVVIETKLKGKIHPWIMNKFDGVWVFTSGLDSGYLGSSVAIIINNFLARHVCKIFKVSGQFFFLKLLFKNNLFVSILELYAGASSVVWFSQAGEINSFIAKVVNKSFFVVLGGNFNENSAQKCVSFRKYFDLGLVNSLRRSLFAKIPTWTNSRDVTKALNYIFVSLSLVNAVIDGSMASVEDYFDTNYKAVSISVGLGGEFKDATATNAAMFLDKFGLARRFSDLDAMWDIVCKIMIFSADGAFKKKWFKSYNRMFTKESFKLHNLEILVSKIVKTSCKVNSSQFESLLRHWVFLNSDKAFVVWNFMSSGANLDHICSVLCGVRRSYHASKLAESLQAKELDIRSAIEKKMENFVVNKDHTIYSVLEYPFCKVVLDHLVSDGNLILDPMEKTMLKSVSNLWQHQYLPLDYVNDNAFFDVMDAISLDDLTHVVKNLPDGKAAGLSGLLLDLLNIYLVCESGVLMNTRLIVLIKTACKILFKLLFNRILSACSLFNVFHENNFSVLKGTTTQSPIFAIGLVVEDALEKDRELWLVLQNMHKAYNSAGLLRDFSNEALHHPFLYDLKSFEQLQIECKVASVLCFSNAGGVLGHLLGQYLSSVNMRVINIYTDRLLRDLGSYKMKCGAAAYFSDLDLGIGARVGELVSSIIVEL